MSNTRFKNIKLPCQCESGDFLMVEDGGDELAFVTTVKGTEGCIVLSTHQARELGQRLTQWAGQQPIVNGWVDL